MTMENKNMNIPNVTAGDIVDMLSVMYANVIQGKMSFGSIPTPFLWGPAGIGKSEAIAQLAQRLEGMTHKRVVVTDVRLLLFSPLDLRGIAVPDVNHKFCHWLKPQIFSMDASEDCVNVLFLDELSAAPQSVQAAAYQICLNRRIGEHVLPDNCIVIAAGNRTTDQSVSFKMPKALCNRLMHFNVETNYSSWLKWALAHDIDSRIIGYLAFDNSKLYMEPAVGDMAYPTPRSWAFVSNLIKATKSDLQSMHSLISACIGTDTAVEFEMWARSHTELPRVSDVFAGRCTKYPKSQDALLAFIASLVTAVRARRSEITTDELENMCAYAKRFPADFATMFYGDLNESEEIRLKLMRCPSCKRKEMR